MELRVGNGDGAAAHSHAVLLYERDSQLFEELCAFLEAGLEAREAVLVVATAPHLERLAASLAAHGFDLAAARAEQRYWALDAHETLADLLDGGRIDERRFQDVADVVTEAARRRGHVRVFGEMVALLVADGNAQAALRLEGLWDELARALPLSLLCAYPMEELAGQPPELLAEVCASHSRVLPAESYAYRSSMDERLRPVADLQEAAARLAAIVECSDDAIVGKTLAGVVTSWNRAAERLFGYTAEEMIGCSIARIIPADCRDDLVTILGTIGRGERVDHYETQRLHKDGRRIDVSLTVSPIKDASGRIVGASKIARDITQQLRSHKELQQERAALDTLQSVSLTLSAELDLDRLLQAVTDAATRLSGATYGAFFYRSAGADGGRFVLQALSGVPTEAFASLAAPRNTPLFEPTFAGEAVVRSDDITRDPRYGRNAPFDGTPPGHLRVRSYLAVPITSRGVVFGGLLLGHPLRGVFSERSERVSSQRARTARWGSSAAGRTS